MLIGKNNVLHVVKEILSLTKLHYFSIGVCHHAFIAWQRKAKDRRDNDEIESAIQYYVHKIQEIVQKL